MIANASKRFLSLVLALIMVLSMIPSTVLEVSAYTGSLNNDLNLSPSYSGSKNNNVDWTLSGTSIEGTATNTENCGSVSTHSETLRLTYTGTEKVTLEFTYTLTNTDSPGSVTFGDATVVGNKVSKVMSQNSYVDIKLSSAAGKNGGTSKVEITGITLKADETITVTFKPAANGSYTVTNAAGTTQTVTNSQITVSQAATAGYALEATPASGYTFVGWWNETDGAYVSGSATLENQTFSKAVTIYPKFTTTGTALFGVDTLQFDNLTEAANYAKNSGKTQVNLLNNGTLTGNHTIPAGVTLLIPFDSANTCYTTTPGNTGNAGGWTDAVEVYETPSPYRTLTMAAGSSITVNGAISVSAKHTAGVSKTYGSAHLGAVSGKYGHISMAQGSSITLQNGGRLYAWGYITGDGSVTAKSGSTVYELMQVAEFRGGTVLEKMSSNPATYGNVFPFSQYYVQNIEVLLTLEAGAMEYAYTTLLVKVAGPQSATVEFIGDNGLFKLTSGKVTKKYDGSRDRLLLDIYGDVELSALKLSIYMYSFNSSNYTLPLNNNLTIGVHSGTATLGQNVALLPGTEVTIDKGATLKIASGKSAYIYDSKDWVGKNFVHVSQDLAPVAYAPGKKEDRATLSGNNYVAPNLADSIIDVNGLVEVDGYIYTTANNAQIISSEGTGIIRLNTAAGTTENTYQFQYDLFSGDNTKGAVAVAVNPAKLLNGNGSYTETAGAAAEDTFVYTGTGTAGKWVKQVKISFDANGGSGTMDAQTVTSGVNATIKANAFTAPAGNSFAGWNTAADGKGTAYADGGTINVTAKTTLYAQWKLNEYTVTFNAGGGTGTMASQTLQHGVAEALDQNAFTRTGYTFQGWATTEDGNVAYADKAEITATGNVTLYAVWKVNSYDATFDANGGAWADGTTTKTVPTAYGAAITAPENPTRTGYTFAGWTPAVGNMDDVNGMTFTAKWTVNKYKLTINFGDTTFHTFLTNADGKVEGGSRPMSNPLTMDLDYGKGGAWIIIPGGKTGHSFSHFVDQDGNQYELVEQEYLNAGSDQTVKLDTFVLDAMPAKDLTLTPVWTTNSYTITWMVDGETVQEKTYLYNATVDAVHPADPSKTGYTFNGWDKEVPATMPGYNVVISAWLTTNQHTVTLNLGEDSFGSYTNSGPTTLTGTVENDYYYGNKVIIPITANSKTGYTFSHFEDQNGTKYELQDAQWYILPMGEISVKAIVINSMPDADLTLTDVWTANSYDATFNANGGAWADGDTSKNVSTAYGAAIAAPADPARTGYTFNGWSPTVGNMDAEGKTFTAQWIANSYTATFNANGGAWADGDTTKTVSAAYGAAIAAPAAPTRTGYTFNGWTPAVGSMDDVNGKTFTAQWTVNSYDATFNADGGAWADGDTTKTVPTAYGTAISAPENPTREGYEFAGWSPAVGKMDDVNGKTFTAQWTANEYTVTWTVDGETYTTTQVKYGETVTAPEGIPTKDQNGCNTYTFAGWEGLTGETVQGLENLTFEATFTEGKSHAWSTDVSYNFAANGSACTATRVCTRDDSHTETATAKQITYEEKTPATCTAEGWNTYTATFEEDWAETQTKDVQDIPLDDNNHSSNEVYYEYNDTRTHIVYHACCDEVKETVEHSYDENYVCVCDAISRVEVTFAEEVGTVVPALTVPAGAPYSVSYEQWSEQTSGYLDEGDKLVLGGIYELYAELEPNGDYVFAEDAVLVINGVKQVGAFTGSFTYEFDLIETIGLVEISFEAPKGNQGAPTITIPANAHYKLGTVKWWEKAAYEASLSGGKPLADGFTFGLGEYVLYIDFRPETGYIFDSNTKVTVNGETPSRQINRFTDTLEFAHDVAVTECAHNWGDATHTWTLVEGAWTCTAKRICTLGCEETATATVTSAVTTTADCKTEEVVTYTATFSETWADRDQKEVPGEKNPEKHVGGTEIRDAKDATVNAPGYTGDTYCLGCGKKIETGAEIPQLQTKVETTTEYKDEDIPADLRQNENFNTVVKIETELKTVVTEKGVAEDNTILYDATLMYSADEGATWAEASEEHFPTDGKLLVTLPVPAGTDPETHEYHVVHMFTSTAFGKIVGNTEMPAVTEVTENGEHYIQFYVTGLSPIMVGFVEDTHTVTFNGNGADSGTMDPQTIGEVTESALTANAFVKTGYTFLGWDADDDGDVDYTDKQSVTLAGDVTLKAVWKVNSYTITWKLNDGAFTFAEDDLVLPVSAAYGENVAITGIFGKTGHTLAAVKDQDGKALEETASSPNTTYSFTMPAENVTITVTWTVNSYALTWVIDGESRTEQVEYGAAITEPAAPTKQGYTFDGWSGTVPATMPAEATTITLTSTWTPAANTYQVETYTMDQEGNYGAPVVETVTEGVKTDDVITLTPTASEGFTLDTEASVLEATVAADGSTVLKVYFIRNQYDVTWDVDGAQTVKTYYYGETVEKHSDPSKEGHTFADWVDAQGNAVEIPATMPAEDMTFYASWTVNKYTATFLDNDGSELFEWTIPYGKAIQVLTVTKVGHTFAGWVDAQGNAVEIPATMPASNLTFYASWTVNQYDIHWDYDGDGNVDETTTAHYGDKLAPADRVKDADKVNTYKFLGWSTEKNGEILSELLVTGEVTYYAVFQATPIIYTMTFDAQGGEDVEAMTGGYEAVITLPEATGKTGHTFIGWAETLDPDAQIMEAGSEYTITDNDTLYAVWQINEYTVTWIINGTKMMATYEYGERIKAYTPTWEGYTFIGWDKEVPETMPAENLVFTARWEGMTFTIGWDIDGDGEAEFEDTVDWNEIPVYDAEKHGQITKPADAEKIYTFAGWTVEPVAAVADVVYTAKFDYVIREYTITWNIDGQTSTTSVAYGSVPAWTGAVPTRAEDNYNTYEFASWNTDAQGNGNGLAAVTGEATYYAVFDATAKVYTLTLDLDGGVIGGQTAVVIEGGYGMAITAPAEPVKTGYSFSGWSEAIPATLTENKTVKALWTVNRYTITFNTDGGSEIAPITLDYGAQIEVPADPTKEGYSFNSWTPAIPATMPAENVEVTAGWTVNQYTIIFDTNGGTEIAPITQDYNTRVTAPEDPTKEGYTFVKWVDETGADAEVPEAIPAGNVKLTAVWSANENTINFYTSEDTQEAYHTITANTDAELTDEMKPADPTKEGYIFGGWVDAEGNAVVIGQTMPSKSMDLYAKWNVGQYTISFDLDGGKIGDQSAVTISQNYGIEVTAPETPVKEGYKFLHWADENGDEIQVPEKMPGRNMTLKAVWQIQQYTITFQDEDGNTLDSITADYGTVIEVPAVTKEGHSFVKWNSGIPATMPAKDVVITSTWRVNQYFISFNTNGGTSIEAIVADYGTAVTRPADPTRIGYTFAGWDVEFPETMPAGGLTLTAQWDINQYLITWKNWNGADLGSSTADHGQMPAFSGTPVKEASDAYSYEFVGWNTAADGSGKGLTEATGAAVYYAQYKQIANEYTITFNTDGGTAIDSITRGYGSKVQAPADPTKEGYVFAGWDQEIPETMPAQNMTINAKWEKVKYTITFDTDGGSNTAAIEAGWGEAITAPADPTKEGHTFIGWVNAAGEAVTIPETMPVGGLALKAQWKVNEYTVTWKVDGREIVETYAYGAQIVEPANVSKEGYTFIGWDQDVPATMPAENLVLEAQWKYTYTGWKTEEGGITYLIDGEKEYFDTWAKIGEELYYFDDLSYVLTDICKVVSRNGTYEGLFVFDKNTGAFASDLTGVYVSNSGDIYYIVKGEANLDMGLVRTVTDEGVVEYYYFCNGAAVCNLATCQHNGTAVKNGVHWVEQNNGMLVKWDYTFDANGVIVHHEDTTRQGIHADENGVDCYYIDGVKVHRGLFKVGEDYYYARSNAELVKNKTYWVSVTNGLLKEGSYVFDEDGKIVFDDGIDESKNGIYAEDGSLYYYVDGVRTYAGLIEIDGSYYYVKTNCEVVHGGIFWITKTNGLMKQGNYNFDENGKMIEMPVQELKNGIYEENGGLYYYKDGKLFYAGLIEIDGYYYYVNSSCRVITAQNYWISKTNGLMPERSYTFDEQGRMVDPLGVQPAPDGEGKNGIVDENGTLYYYENGVLTYAGLIEIDGYYYYVKSDCTAVRNGTFWITKTNGIVSQGRYTFDAEGRMVIE